MFTELLLDDVLLILVFQQLHMDCWTHLLVFENILTRFLVALKLTSMVF